MKKIILIISVIALVCVMALGFVACNNATPQGQLANLLALHNHEAFTYEVVDSRTPEDKGVYTVTLDAYKAGATVENFGSATLTDVKDGVLVTGVLEIGNTVYRTGCYFNLIASSTSYMLPQYSYRIETVDGVEKLNLQGSYSGSKYNYDATIDGQKKSGSIKLSGSLYFDNNEFQQSLRTLTTFSSGVALSFSLPLVSKQETSMVTLTASMINSEKIKVPYTEGKEKYTDGIECYVLHISRSAKVNSVRQTLYYAVNNIPLNEEHPDNVYLKNILVKMVEPYKLNDVAYTVTYTLLTADLA